MKMQQSCNDAHFTEKLLELKTGRDIPQQNDTNFSEQQRVMS
jgi:hypothetical protein